MGSSKKQKITEKHNNKYDPTYCDQMITMAKQGMFPTHWCMQFGISEKTLYDWAIRYPEFGEAKNIAVTALQAIFEEKLRAYALNEVEDYNSGNIKALDLILKSHFKQTYTQTTLVPKVTINQYANISTEALMEKVLLKAEEMKKTLIGTSERAQVLSEELNDN